MTEQDLYESVIEAATAVALRLRELPYGIVPSDELDALDLAVRRAGADQERIYEDLGAAHRACEAGQVVARLSGLERWIVVSTDDFMRYGDACGWSWEREPALRRSDSWLLAQAAACMVGMGYGPLLEARS